MKTLETSKTLPAEQNSGHTPGPWKICTYRPHRIIARDPKESTYEKGDDKFPSLAEVRSDSPYTDLQNARLIAAAPELMEALEQAVEFFRYMIEDCAEPSLEETATIRDEARAAIAKAKGA